MNKSRLVRVCDLSGTRSQVVNNKPKSQHKTKRLVHPNLQKWNGLIITNRTRRTLKKYAAESAKI